MAKPVFLTCFLLALAALVWRMLPDEADKREMPASVQARGEAFAREPDRDVSARSDESLKHTLESGSDDRGLTESETRSRNVSTGEGPGRITAFDEEHLRRLQTEARQADRLDAESVFLDGGSVQGDTAIEVLNAGAEEFDVILSELEQQSQMDPLSSELTDVYRDFLNNDPSLDDHGPVMDRLACGLRICIGESFAGQEHWDQAMMRMRDGAAPPSFAMLEIPLYDAAGVLIGRRLMFSTDEQNNSVTMPISYQPPSPPHQGDSDGG